MGPTSNGVNKNLSINIQHCEDSVNELNDDAVITRKPVNSKTYHLSVDSSDAGKIRGSLDRNEEVLNELFHSNSLIGFYQIFLVIITGCVVGVVTLGFQKGQEALEKAYIHDFVVDDFAKAATCIIMVFSAGISSFIALYVSKKWFPECLGGGIIPLKIAIGVSSPIPFYFVFARAFVTTVYISFGNPLGIEGPVLHIAGAIASQFYLIGTYFSREVFEGTLSTTLMVGTAAGISAAFNTPLAGIFYAVEEFLDTRKFGFVTILVGFASVASTILVRLINGEELLFEVNNESLSLFSQRRDSVVNIWMMAAIPLGLLCGSIGYVFKISVIHLREYLFYSETPIGNKHSYFVSIFSGIVVGILGVFTFIITDSQYSWGAGVHWIDEVLQFDRSGWKYLGFALLKTMSCVVAVSVGGNGGVFVPSLVIGASIGGAFASLMCTLFDEGSNTLDPIDNRDCIWFTSFIEFGMAGVFTSILRLPLTSIVIVYELTNFADVASSLIIPLLTCVLCSFATSLYLEEDSIYELLLKQDGINTVLLDATDTMTGEADVIDLNDPFSSRGHNVGFHRQNSLQQQRSSVLQPRDSVVESNSRLRSGSRVVGVLDPGITRPGSLLMSPSATIGKIRHSRSNRRSALTNEDTESYSILNILANRANEYSIRSNSRVNPDVPSITTGSRWTMELDKQTPQTMKHSNSRPINKDLETAVSGPRLDRRDRKLSVPNIDNGRVYFKERVGRLSFIEEENPHLEEEG